MANSINFNGNFTNMYYECIAEDLLTSGKYDAVNCGAYMGIDGINTVIDVNISDTYVFDTEVIRDDVYDKLAIMKTQGKFTGTISKE